MSLLIKNVEMPTDHPLWIVVHSDGTVEANEVSASRPVGWQTLRDAAVPVHPPYGRLGDLDDFAKRMKDLVEKANNDGFDLGAAWYSAFVRHIELTPTVIEADRGDDQ